MNFLSDEHCPSEKNVALEYSDENEIKDITELEGGNINKTYLVRLKDQSNSSFILQRMSKLIFKKPEHLIHNIDKMNNHISNRLKSCVNSRSRFNIVCPNLISPRRSSQKWIDRGDFFWKSLTFIDSSISLQYVDSCFIAYEVGKGLSSFHELVSDMDISCLHEIIPYFHSTIHHIDLYNQALKAEPKKGFENRKIEKKVCQLTCQINDNIEVVKLLHKSVKDGELNISPTHGDPKISNFLFNNSTHFIRAIIDFDTFQPGFKIFDLADCLRSCCNQAGESPVSLSDVHFDIELFRCFLEGYLSVNPKALNLIEKKYLPIAIRVICLELGVRFLTDYIQGDVYFKARRTNENLYRAETQFALLGSIINQTQEIENLILNF